MLLLIPFALAGAPAPTDLVLTDVVLGEGHACARVDDGGVACWGRNDRGQLGRGAGEDTATPVRIPGLDDVVALTAGDEHTCALRRDRSVWCWGDAREGQVGAAPLGYQAVPQPVALGPVKALAAGAFHTCAALIEGGVACWGQNLYGQLGTTDVGSSPFPLPIPGIRAAVAVAAGYGHTCAVLPADPPGSGPDFVSCWGDDRRGQLGRPDPGDGRPLPPGPVAAALEGVRGLSARDQRTCAVHRGGVTCWGPAGGDPAPAQVIEASDLVTVSVGWGHGCALALSGRVTCFGEGGLGQTGARSPRPVVPGAYGLTDAVAVAAGHDQSCAARARGDVVCWGSPTLDERRVAELEKPEPYDVPKTRLIRQFPPGTALTVEAEEVLTPDGGRVRFTVQTLETNPCANSKLAVEATTKGKSLRLALGDAFLPSGDCIAVPGPASAVHDLPVEASGRYDLVLRWRKREDFYQVWVKKDRVEVVPLQTTFSYWTGEKLMHRVPYGSLAISCLDLLDDPLCVRRARDGMPTCALLRQDEAITGAPQLPDQVWASPWFAADPSAKRISPDLDLEGWEKRIEKELFDGSGCFSLDVRTWSGATWTNHPPR